LGERLEPVACSKEFVASRDNLILISPARIDGRDLSLRGSVVDLNRFKYFGGVVARLLQVSEINAAVPALVGVTRPVLSLEFVQKAANESAIVGHCGKRGGRKAILRAKARADQ
jgi:hypothetical protein